MTEAAQPAVESAALEPRGRVLLGGSCTIYEAAAIKAHMLEQLARPGPCEIDGSAVGRVDTAGVQLCVAFALDCLERGLECAWTGRSEALDQAITTLGVGALL
jgi:anti-anti-sigma regulatory factor